MVIITSLIIAIVLLIIGFFLVTDESLRELRKKQIQSLSPEGVIRKQLDNIAQKVVGEDKHSKIKTLLLQANMPLRTGDFLALSIISGLMGLIVGSTIMSFVGSITGLVVGLTLPYQIIKFIRNQRVQALSEQVGPTLTMLAKQYQATEDFAQAITFVANEITEQPMHNELQRMVNHLRLGGNLEEALDNWALRTANKYVALFVKYAKISTRIGTQKTRVDLLNKVPDMYDRHLAIQAEMKKQLYGSIVTAYALIAFIPGAIIFKSLTDSNYLAFMTGTLLGQIILLAAVVAMAMGIWFINTKIAAPLDE